jgi:hypothetical protein
MALTAEETKTYQDLFERTRNDIRAFASMVNFTPYGGQRDFCDMVEMLTLDPTLYPKQIGVKAGTGVGKSRVLAFTTLWRTWRWPGSKALNTAPTEDQCRKIFFAELAEMVSASPLLSAMMEITEARAHFVGRPNWQIYAKTAGDENALRGAHHPGLTIAAEEITGIKNEFLAALLRTCSQQENLFIAIFNPDKPSGLAYEMFNSKKKFWPWNLTIDKLAISREAPHIVDPRILECWREEHGEDSDFWRVGVLGLFPGSNANGIIHQYMIDKSIQVPVWEGILGKAGMSHARIISVDFAREGGDECVAYARAGNAIVAEEIHICDPREISRKAMDMQDRLGWDDDSTLYILDGIGIGQGAIINFEDRGKNIKFFHPIRDSPVEGFKDELSAAWFNAATRMKYQRVHMPNDDILHEQLKSRAFHTDRNLITVETKKQYKKRGFSKSPDRSDAFIMCFSEEEDMLDNQDAMVRLTHMYKMQSHKPQDSLLKRMLY